MAKIPVGKTIARAYSFAFRDFFRILGVMWLPMAIMWIPGIFLQQRMMALQAQATAGNLAAFRELWPILSPLYLVIFVILFMQIIGIAKLALGIKKGPAWFYFSFGKPVWRLIGSLLLLLVAMFVGALAVLLGGVAMGFLVGLLTKAVNNNLFTGIVGILAVVAMIALWCAYFYALVRLTFFLVPVIAAEEQGFALARCWTLGHRNFWRAFVVLLAIVAPMFVLEFAFLFGFVFRGLPFPTDHADAAQAAIFQAAINARSVEMVQAMYHYWYLTFPIAIVVMVLFYGAYIGAPCFAYRALTEGEASGPVTAD
jgi:hypothetical protein